jgi:rhodanese-related sulfurtransferase
MSIPRQFLVGLVGVSLIAASCGGDDQSGGATVTEVQDGSESSQDATAAGSIEGLSTISAQEAAAITEDPPAGLVVLDVRTPEEFSEGHLDGSVLVDFYETDFAEQLAALDPDVPYLVYCRSGNRSGQALDIMAQLGFASAANVDGGILAWADAGLPITTG